MILGEEAVELWRVVVAREAIGLENGGGGLVSGIIAVPKRYLGLALALDLGLILDW